ncbi:MAG: hypothetical protein VB029_03145 [Anaerolineaceae bacterium]|jgi:hypothetical protein|nr:hypothetical protein [Anaerolineaceae bacterium]HNX46527.1 hypothetical protein [Anaerolineaceae bacterium]HPT23172.1 hypothetical protein [Anaerolineaceae bacterium]
MSRKTIKTLLVLLGILAFGVSFAADYIYPGYYPGIHSTQVIGMAFGGLLLLVGLFLPSSKA